MTVSSPSTWASASAPLARTTGSIVAGSYTLTPACSHNRGAESRPAVARRSHLARLALRSAQAQLARVRRLPYPVSPRGADARRRRILLQPLPRRRNAPGARHDDFLDVLSRRQALDAVWSIAPSGRATMNALTTEVDVGFAQRHRIPSTRFACSSVSRPPAQRLDDVLDAGAERVEIGITEPSPLPPEPSRGAGRLETATNAAGMDTLRPPCRPNPY